MTAPLLGVDDHGVPVPGGSSSDLDQVTGSGYTDTWYDLERSAAGCGVTPTR